MERQFKAPEKKSFRAKFLIFQAQAIELLEVEMFVNSQLELFSVKNSESGWKSWFDGENFHLTSFEFDSTCSF